MSAAAAEVSVPSPEASSTVVSPQSAKFTWRIDNFSTIASKKLYSDVFLAGGYKWRLLVFPNGNNVDQFSIYLDAADAVTLPYGWSRPAIFKITVVNQVNGQKSVTKEAHHLFGARESDWGFTSFMPLGELYDPTRGFIVNDACMVEVDVNIVEKELSKLEKADPNLYITIKVACDEDLVKQIGSSIYFDLVDHEKVHGFRILKQTTFKKFKEEVAKVFGVPVQYQRFWWWVRRQNNTYRPSRPLNSYETSRSVGQLEESKAKNGELKLFLEVELRQDLQPTLPPRKTKEDILLFFKLYDPLKEELRYIGRMFVKSNGKPVEVLAKINELAGFSPDEEIELYEEIKFEPSIMCEPLDDINSSFQSNQFEDGDIICVQKSSEVGNLQYRYPDIPSFLEFVRNRQSVRFRSLEKPKEDGFSLNLSKLHTYDDVVERVAQHLGLDDPSKIRLTSHNCYSQQPKPQPIKYRGVDHLSDMLIHNTQNSDILYYEVLDIPLPELQGLKTLKVSFCHATMDNVVTHTIKLPKQSTVEDVLNELKPKLELSSPHAELRLLEVFYHKIYKIFPLHEKIENLNDQYWTFRVEEVPEEEKNLGPHNRLIHVYHFTKETTQYQGTNTIVNFGEPFLLVIHEGETLAKVKVRIQKKLQVPDVEFAKWKFAFLSLGRHEYLKDSDIISARFEIKDTYGAWDQYLGLEHSDVSYHKTSRQESPEKQDESITKEVDASDSDEEMDAFFENLVPEISTSNNLSPDVKEALAQIEAALDVDPTNFNNPETVSKVKTAFSVLSAHDYSSKLPVEQKRELLAMEKRFEDLNARAAKAIEEKNLLTEKESLKSTMAKNLGGYYAEYKEVKTEIAEAEMKVDALQKQVDTLRSQIEEARKKKHKVFHLSKNAKAEMDELVQNWPEYEAKMKAAEEEEKEVEAERCKMKDFILSLKKKSS